MKSLVVLPTYNEKGNIEKIIPEVLAIDENIDILIIDDNSPDGTGQIADALAKDNPGISVMHRPGKMGLGTAYIEGFKWAVTHNYDNVFEMDSDFSHEPKSLADFIKGIASCDVIIGSRYVPGGHITGWGPIRYFISMGGNLFARMLLGIPVKDCTSGFRCYKVSKLKTIDFENIQSEGYGFQVEILYLCYKNSFNIQELPITFADRRVGKSKMSKKILFEALKRVLVLRLKGVS